MKIDVYYENPRTGKTWSTERPLWKAPDDGQYLNLNPGSGLKLSDIDMAHHSLWRYRKAIRVTNNGVISLGEGLTPLIEGKWNEVSIYFKMDYLSPSGSFKDRGISVLLTYLKQRGITSVIEDSSGNAGASMAMYASHGNIDCTIVAPHSTPEPKIVQMQAMGAHLKLINGSRDQVAAKTLRLAKNIFYAGHAQHPYFLEGTKTVAFEIWEQFKGKAPDCVIAPLGQGGNILGSYIGFKELLHSNSVKKIPKIFGVQAFHCAPFYWASQGKQPPQKANKTVADGIAIKTPIRLHEVLKAFEETRGSIVAVSESEIIEALHKLHKRGFYVEPTSAAALAGLSRLLNEGKISSHESIVVILTGNGLKTSDVIGKLSH